MANQVQALDWFNNASAYHILIDRFAGCRTERVSAAEFAGGTLRGIQDKLDYLADLGVDTLWLSPFCCSVGYHGYYTTDYFSVEPHFGNEDDLRALTAEAHRRGMRLVADFVPNHCSVQHPFFQEAAADRGSPYVRWFHFTRWPDRYLGFLGMRHMPKINVDYPPARDHLIAAARKWLGLGVDGLRLDHAIGPSHRFWQHFGRAIKNDFPGAILIGEVWLEWVRRKDLPFIRLRRKHLKYLLGTSAERIYREYARELDGVLDFAAQKILCEWTQHGGGAEELAQQLARHYAKLPRGFKLPAFLDNHDMDRFLFSAGQDKAKLRRAAEQLLALPHPVILYYGTEIGMTQPFAINDTPPGGDHHAVQRQPMAWHAIDQDLLSFFRARLRERRARRG